MNTSRIIVPLPGEGDAVIDLPSPLTPHLLSTLESSLAGAIARLRQALSVDALDPGLIEYASWLPAGRH